jgi:hypothetical protein
LERGSCFCSSGTIPGAFATSRSAAMGLGYPRRCNQFFTQILHCGLPGSRLAFNPRLDLRCCHTRAREALPDVRAIILLSRRRVHEFVIHFYGNVKEVIHPAVRELQLEGPTTICLFMVSDFKYALRGNRDPIHLLRAPFRCGDSSRGRFGDRPVTAFVSTLVFGLFLPGLHFEVRRPNHAPTAEF